MIDCSHANSQKKHERQILVAENVTEQLLAGNQSIIGLMLESHLEAGNQSLQSDPLRYGVSITDACIDWDSTATLLRTMAEKLKGKLTERSSPSSSAA